MTGPTKKVLVRPAFVSTAAWFAREGWLVEGYRMWQALAPFDRDYFHPRPLPDYSGATPGELTYSQAAALGTLASSSGAGAGRGCPALGRR